MEWCATGCGEPGLRDGSISGTMLTDGVAWGGARNSSRRHGRLRTDWAFRELRALAECFGFTLRRIAGSHRVYEHPGHSRPLSFQPRGKMARGYQVRQLLKAIDELEEADG